MQILPAAAQIAFPLPFLLQLLAGITSSTSPPLHLCLSLTLPRTAKKLIYLIYRWQSQEVGAARYIYHVYMHEYN